MSSGIFYPHDFQLDVCTFWLPSPVSHPNSPQQPHALLASGSHQSVLWALFACLDFTYKWYYMVFFFLWLISLSIMPSRPILIDKCQNFIILWFNNIPFCVYKYIYVNTHAYFIYIYIHTHTLFHPFICGWTLMLLPFLAIVHNAAVNMWGHITFHVSVFIFIFWISYPKLEFLDHMVPLFLFFWRSSILFSIVGASVYNSAREFLFSISLPTLVISLSFWY